VHQSATVFAKSFLIHCRFLYIRGLFFVFSAGRPHLFPKTRLPVSGDPTSQPAPRLSRSKPRSTDKIEEAVNTISGIDELRHRRRKASRSSWWSFVLDKDADSAAQEVRDKSQRAMSELPEDRSAAAHRPLRSRRGAGHQHRAHRQQAECREVTEYADKVLRRQLESVQRRRAGPRARRPAAADQRLARRPIACAAYNLTVTDVSRALQAQNIEVPGGRIDQGQHR
jgi:HAE1 family hydrophobic/amphiphilic exporter-1